MKMRNKNLSEAPDLKGNVKGRPNTLGQRFKQKLKKHAPFSKKKRGEAETKDAIFRQAKDLKNKFAQHMQNYPAGTTPTVNHLEEFFKDSEYDEYVNQVAIDLEFRKQERPEEKAPSDSHEKDAAPTKVGGDTDGDNLELEKEKKPEETEDEIKAVYKKMGDELEAKRKASPGGELVDEDEESKTDTSASIYESRLRKLLLELKDNEIDTLIVRIIQAKNRAKGGPAKPSPEQSQKSSNDVRQPESEPEQSYEAEGGFTLDEQDTNNLSKLLSKILNDGKIDKHDKRIAKTIAKQIQNQ